MTVRPVLIAMMLSLVLAAPPNARPQQPAARRRTVAQRTGPAPRPAEIGPALTVSARGQLADAPEGIQLRRGNRGRRRPTGQCLGGQSGAWPIMQFDKNGKMLQAWNHDTVRVTPGVGKGTHGLKVDPEGNVWLVDVDGHILLKYSPEGRHLMTIGNRQGTEGNNDDPTAFNRPTNLWFLPTAISTCRMATSTRGWLSSPATASTSGTGGPRAPGRRVQPGARRHRRLQRYGLCCRPQQLPGADLRSQRQVRYQVDRYRSALGPLLRGQGRRHLYVRRAVQPDREVEHQGEILGVLGSYGKAPGMFDLPTALLSTPRGASTSRRSRTGASRSGRAPRPRRAAAEHRSCALPLPFQNPVRTEPP